MLSSLFLVLLISIFGVCELPWKTGLLLSLGWKWDFFGEVWEHRPGLHRGAHQRGGLGQQQLFPWGVRRVAKSPTYGEDAQPGHWAMAWMRPLHGAGGMVWSSCLLCELGVWKAEHSAWPSIQDGEMEVVFVLALSLHAKSFRMHLTWFAWGGSNFLGEE